VRCLLAIGLLLAAPRAPAVEPLTPEQLAGRAIYLAGERPGGGGINAFVGGDPSPLPGASLPCAGCHGPDGRGRPEGGVVPPAIAWSELTGSRGHEHRDRRHPAFDERSLGRAITEGVDPAGHPLSESMPRYSLSGPDLAALLAWLKVLERQAEPGLSVGVFRLATVLPAGAGRPGEVGEALLAALEAALAELNAGGGINGRRLELDVVRYDPARSSGVEALERRLERAPAFALLSGFVPGEEAALAELAERLAIPLVGPFGPYTAGAPGHWTFYTLAGIGELGQVLVGWAGDRSGLALVDPSIAVLHPAGAPFEAASLAVTEAARRRGWKRLVHRALPAAGLDEAGAGALREAGVELLLVLGDDPVLASVLRAGESSGFHPWVLAVGTLAARAAAGAPAAFEGRLRLAYPSLPLDESEAGRSRLERLAPPGAGARLRAVRASALLAVTALAEGLGRAGHAPTRAGLVERLESLSGFETGLSPPLGFGAQRRVGARGGYVVAVELASRTFRPASGWLGLE
jgi:ABC-type branched-subunit amino acid transport system substrate-binding protein